MYNHTITIVLQRYDIAARPTNVTRRFGLSRSSATFPDPIRKSVEGQFFGEQGSPPGVHCSMVLLGRVRLPSDTTKSPQVLPQDPNWTGGPGSKWSAVGVIECLIAWLHVLTSEY